MNKKEIVLIALFILCSLVLTACNNRSSVNANSNSAGADMNNNVATSNGNNVASAENTVQKISDIQKPENVGKTVTVQGKVVNTLQSARYGVSGYKIQDSAGTMIDISSKKIPQINTTITVTGTLIQTRFFGLVINETS